MGHDFRRSAAEQPWLHMAAQIAICQNAGELTVLVNDAKAAEALLGHHNERRAHAFVCRHDRKPIALMHDVAHMLEGRAELAARMKNLEILGRKAAAFEERDGKAVAQ